MTSDPKLDRAKEPLKRFLMRNRNLSMDEKVEAYGMLLDCVIEVIKTTNESNLEQTRKIFLKQRVKREEDLQEMMRKYK